MKPLVYLTNETLRRNRQTGDMERVMDIKSAYSFGDVVFLLPPGPLPADFGASIDALAEGLEGFTRNDYLIAAGDMVAFGAASALAAHATGGRVNFLHWVRDAHRYRKVEVQLWGEGDEK